MNFRTAWYETPDLLFADCRGRPTTKVNGPGLFGADPGTATADTHLEGFDEDIVHSVMRACKVADRELFTSRDAGPGGDGPLHLLHFGFLILVSILQPVAKSSEKPFQ